MIEDYNLKHKQDYGMWRKDPDFYSKDILDLASRRIRNLMHYSCLSTESLEKLLKAAYLQGLVDGIEGAEQSGEERE